MSEIEHANYKPCLPSPIMIIGIVLFLSMLLLAAPAHSYKAQTHSIPSPIKLTEEEREWIRDHPVVRLGGSPFFEPLLIESEDGSLSGVYSDIFNELEKLLPIKFDIKTGAWADIVNMARSREIDGLMACTPSQAKASYLIPTTVTNSIYPIVYINKSNPFPVRNYNDLKGKKIAYHKGTKFIEDILALYQDVSEIYPADSGLSVLTLLLEGTVDAALLANFENYLVAKHTIHGVELVYSDLNHLSPMSPGIRNDWPELAGILNKAINAIDQSKIKGIVNKWLHLQTTKSLKLTAEEKAWLKQHPLIRVGHTTELPPFLIEEQKGKLEGIIVDYFSILGNRLGVEVEIVNDKWSTILSKVKSGEIDVVGMVATTGADKLGFLKSREHIDFPAIVYGIPEKGIRINNLDNLNGLKVSVFKDVIYLHSYLDSRRDELEILEADSTIQAMQWVVEGKADVMLGLSTAGYQLTKKHMPGIKPLYISHELTAKTVTGVRPDWPVLVNILNKAFDTISPTEIAQILDKWNILPETFTDNTLKLLPEEKAWLKEHPIIRVGSDTTWAPVEFLNENDEYTGFSIDYLKKIETLLGIRFEFVRENWQELIAKAKRQELDIFSCIARTPERENFLVFTEPYVQMPTGFFALDSVAYIPDLKILKGKKIAVGEGYAIHEYLAANFPDIELVLVKNPKEGIKLVLKGKAFGFIGNTIITGHLLNRKGYLQVKLKGEVHFMYAQSIGVRKDWPQLRNILQKAMDAIPEAEQNAIYNHWVPLIYDKPADYSLIWKIGALIFCIICLVLLWNRKLSSEVNRRTKDLDKANLKYREAQSIAKLGHWEFDLQTNCLDWSDEIYEIFEIDPDKFEASYESFLNLIHPDERAVVNKAYRDSLRNKTPYLRTNRLVMTDGRIKYVHEKCRTEYADNGAPVRSIGTIQDITLEKTAEEKLLRAKDEWVRTFDSVPDLIAILDNNYRIVKVNKAMADKLGVTPDEAIGLICYEHVHGTKEPPSYCPHAKLLKDGQIHLTEFYEERLGGHFLVSVSPLQDNEGNLSGSVHVARDITQQKQADLKLRESETKYRVVVEDTPVLMCRLLPNGEITFVNKAFCNYFAKTLEELTGKSFFSLIHEIDRENVKNSFSLLSADSPIQTHEHRIIAPGGKVGWQKWTNRALFDEHGEIIAYHSLGEDITELKTIEKQKEGLETQLQQAQKMEAIGTLAGGIAHDFNNILSPIMIHSEIALEALPPDSHLQFNLQEIFSAGKRATDLVKQILTFSRKRTAAKSKMKISPILKETIKLLRSTTPTTIEIIQKIETDNDVINCDPTQMHQLILNLCTNAVHAMKEMGGVLEIGLDEIQIDQDNIEKYSEIEVGKFVRLRVKDSGHGMDSEGIENIFEPYYTTKGVGEGTGLGLAVVHGIVEDSGGEILVESEVGKGTTFDVLLPIIDSEVSGMKEEKHSLAKGHESILCVDDEESAVNANKAMLESLGYKVTTRTSSIEAFKLFQHDPDRFDLVITDMTMPYMTGKVLAKEMLSIRSDIPIIICTGFSEQMDDDRAKQIGIKAFVMKPIVMHKMANTIRKVLDIKLN